VSITNAYIDNKGVERSQAPSISSDLFDLDVTSCHTHRSALSRRGLRVCLLTDLHVTEIKPVVDIGGGITSASMNLSFLK